MCHSIEHRLDWCLHIEKLGLDLRIRLSERCRVNDVRHRGSQTNSLTAKGIVGYCCSATTALA
jgi:predicted DNA-binding transcriptional regulator